MKTLRLAVLCLVLVLVLCSCGLLSPQEQQTALAALDEMLRTKAITPAQYAALREALLAGGSGAWWQQFAQVAGSAVLAIAGVRLQRGPPATPDEVVSRQVKRRKAAIAAVPVQVPG